MCLYVEQSSTVVVEQSSKYIYMYFIHVFSYTCVHQSLISCITIYRCLKLQVSFRKRAANYRALLRAMKQIGYMCSSVFSLIFIDLISCIIIYRCLKLQVSFRKRPANYRALLRAMKRL